MGKFVLSANWLRERLTESGLFWARLRVTPLLSVGALNALLLPVALVTSIILARTMPKAEYGHLIYFYSGANLLRLLINLGLGTVVSRDTAASWGERERLRMVVASLTTIRLSSMGVALPVMALVGWLWPIEFWTPMVGAALAASLADFLFALVTGARRAALVAPMSACQPLIYLALALALGGRIDSLGLMAAYCGSFLAMAALGLALLVSNDDFGQLLPGQISAAYIRSALGFAAPSYLAALSSQLWNSIVAGAFGLLGQFERSAEFGIAFSTLSMAVAVSGPTALTIFYPQASYLSSNGRGAELRSYIAQSLSLFIKGLAWAGILLCGAASIIVTLFGDAYTAAGPHIIALAAAAPILGVQPLLTLSLFAARRPWRAVAALAIQATLLPALLIGSGGLTPEAMIWSIYGSSLAGLIAQLILSHDTLDLASIARATALPCLTAFFLGLGLAGFGWAKLPALQAGATVIASVLYLIIAFDLRALLRRSTTATEASL